MATFSSGGFVLWAFATGQPRRDRHGRTDIRNRLIGSIRWECLDYVVVFGDRHLRHILLSYMAYYNGARTHWASPQRAGKRAAPPADAYSNACFAAEVQSNSEAAARLRRFS
jgi:hypothetical protein